MRPFISLLLILWSYTFNVSAQKKFNQVLTDSLNSWVVFDQIAAKSPEGKYKLMSRARLEQFKDSVFTTHQKLLSQVFEKYGYPGYDMVGKEASNHFWLMVQHCDKQPNFQQKVLKAMKKEVDSGNAHPQNFAYLTDRVRLNTSQKQVYGTQITYNTDSCQAIPRALVDSATVNQRRKQVGLPPIEVYLNEMSALHFMMNKASYEKKGILKPKILKLP